jgi:hypothetical protein
VFIGFNYLVSLFFSNLIYIITMIKEVYLQGVSFLYWLIRISGILILNLHQFPFNAKIFLRRVLFCYFSFLRFYCLYKLWFFKLRHPYFWFFYFHINEIINKQIIFWINFTFVRNNFHFIQVEISALKVIISSLIHWRLTNMYMWELLYWGYHRWHMATLIV